MNFSIRSTVKSMLILNFEILIIVYYICSVVIGDNNSLETIPDDIVAKLPSYARFALQNSLV